MIDFKRTPAGDGEITFYDDVGSYWAGSDASTFKRKLDALGSVNSLTMRLHSYGGDVLDGIAIYNMLREHPAKSKTVKVDGLAASMASVLMMAFDKREVSDGAFVMIHNPWSYAIGESGDFKTQADFLDKIKANMVEIYTRGNAAKPSREQIAAMMDATTWMDAKQAKELGFATSIGEPVKIAASALKSSPFNAVPKAALNLFKIEGAQQMSIPKDQTELDAHVAAAVAAALTPVNAELSSAKAKILAAEKERDEVKASLTQANAAKAEIEKERDAEKAAKAAAEGKATETQARLERAIAQGFKIAGAPAGSGSDGGTFAEAVAALVKDGMDEAKAYSKVRAERPDLFASTIKKTAKN